MSRTYGIWEYSSQFFGNVGNIPIQFSNQCYLIFRNLMRKPWIQALNTSATPKDFARALTVLQCCIKPCLMVNVWYESLGHTMLKKISQAMKDDKKKSEKRERYVYFLFLRIHSISSRLVSSHIELETEFISLWSRFNMIVLVIRAN